MTAVLEMIREELRRARRWVQALEQSEALLEPVYEATRSAPARGTSRAHKQRKNGTRLANPSRDNLRTCIYERGPISRGDLLATLGGRASAMDRKLSRMLELGEIEASGRPRLYTRPASLVAAPHHGDPVPAAALEPAAARPPEEGRYPVYDALRESGAATTAQLMARTGLTSNVVFAQARELTRIGLVMFRGQASNRVWHPRPVAAPPRAAAQDGLLSGATS